MNFSGIDPAFEAILQTFTDTNFILAPDGAILDYRSNNPSLLHLFPNPIQSKNIKEIFPSRLTGQLEHALSAAKETGNVISLDYVLPVSNRDYWFEARLIPVSDFETYVDRPRRHRVSGDQSQNGAAGPTDVHPQVD